MKRIALGLALVVIVGGGLVAAARSRHDGPTARETSETDPVAEGVVCFGTVDLEHGVASLLPLQPGRVAEVLVHENDEVARGAVLLRLEDGAARVHVAEAEAALKLAQHTLEEARKLPGQYREQVEQQESVEAAASARLAAAHQLLDQRRKSGQPAAVAAVETSASELEVRELDALHRAEAQRLAGLKARDANAEIRRAELEVAAAEARRDQAKLALAECQLVAPRAGTVLRILVGPGDVLAPERGQPALLFAADGPQVIRATVEQEFAPRLKEGAAVVVEDESDSSVSYRGKLRRIAAWYSQRRTVLHDPSQMSDVRTVECDVVLDPGQPRLRLGQGVRVHIGATAR